MAHSLPRQNDETSKGRFLRKLSLGSLMKYAMVVGLVLDNEALLIVNNY